MGRKNKRRHFFGSGGNGGDKQGPADAGENKSGEENSSAVASLSGVRSNQNEGSSTSAPNSVAFASDTLSSSTSAQEGHSDRSEHGNILDLFPATQQKSSSAAAGDVIGAQASAEVENRVQRTDDFKSQNVVHMKEYEAMASEKNRDQESAGRSNGHGSDSSRKQSFNSEDINRDYAKEPMGARIKVFGIGGGGGNAVNNMIRSGLTGVEFIAANTDAQALKSSEAPHKLQLGNTLTKGLGAGANPDIGEAAARESIEEIREMIDGADMVFITAGMGGGTGGGGASVVARTARESGALAVGVVTKPFLFEGKRRMSNAERGIEQLKKEVDTLITIPNQRLLAIAGRNTTLLDTFRKADDVLFQAVKGISDLILYEGLVNVDFADVKSVMSEMGMAMMGSGEGSGENRAIEAAEKAISSPLLEDISISGARGILINVTAGPDVTLQEINEAAELIHAEAHDEANIIWGMVIDQDMGDNVRVTVIATGFGDREPKLQMPSSTIGTSTQVPKNSESSLGYEKKLDIPAFTRRQKEAQPEVTKLKKVANASNGAEEDDKYEIPTFLRRQID